MFILFIVSSLTVVNLFPHEKSGEWVSCLLSPIISLPTILICGRLTVKNPNMTLSEIVKSSLGNAVGTVVCSLYSLYSLVGAAVSLRLLSEFIHIVSMPKTPEIFVLFVFAFLCARCLSDGLRVFSKFCVFLIPAVFLTIFLSSVLSGKLYDFENLRSFSEVKATEVLVSAVDISAFSFGEIILFTGIFPFISSKNPQKTIKNTILFSVIIGAITLSGILFSTLLVLGDTMLEKLYFPYFAAISLINVSDFITHIEVIAVIMLILTTVVRTGVCLYTATDCFFIKKLYYPFAFFAAVIALFLFDTPPEMIELSEAGKYAGFAFQIIIPVFILIFSEIKEHKHENQLNGKIF